MKSLKSYKKIDLDILKETIKKLYDYLWYLSAETAGLAFFSNAVIKLKKFIVKSVWNEGIVNSIKRFFILLKDIDYNFTGMF